MCLAPRKKAAPRKKKEPLPHGTNLVKIIEADDDEYPGPSTSASASALRANNRRKVAGIKRSFAVSDGEKGEDEVEHNDHSFDEDDEDMLPEDEVWAVPGERPNATRRTRQVARHPRYKPTKRPEAPIVAKQEVIEISDNSSDEPMYRSDEPDAEAKKKPQQKRKASAKEESEDEGEDEAEGEEQEEVYVPPHKRTKISHAERARLAAKRRRGGI